MNYAYEPNRTIIWPSVAPISVVEKFHLIKVIKYCDLITIILQTLWSCMYLRWLADPYFSLSQLAAKSRLREIIDQNTSTRIRVTKLRWKLRDLIQQAERLGFWCHLSLICSGSAFEMEGNSGSHNPEEALNADSTACD